MALLTTQEITDRLEGLDGWAQDGKAIKKQLDKYLHVLVYGEMIQSPQVQYASLLTQQLHNSLNSVYFTNSGAEAVEGAMKLAKRVTGRTQIISFKQSYHGSTQCTIFFTTGTNCLHPVF